MNGPVYASGDQFSAIRGDRDAQKDGPRPFQGFRDLASGSVPNLNRAISAGRHQVFAFAGKSQAEYAGRVLAERANLLARGHIP